jgi:hypothetical protein
VAKSFRKTLLYWPQKSHKEEAKLFLYLNDQQEEFYFYNQTVIPKRMRERERGNLHGERIKGYE